MSLQPWAELSRDSSLLHILSTGWLSRGWRTYPSEGPLARGAGGCCLSPGAQPGLRATALFLPTQALRKGISTSSSGFLMRWQLGSESCSFIKFRFKGSIYPLLNRNTIKIFGDDVFKLPWSIFSPSRDRKSSYLEHRAWGVL